MQEINNIVLDIRSLYACDPNRPGAHFIRRHRVRMLRDDLQARNPVLIGSAIVEVAHVDEFVHLSEKQRKSVFEVDEDWQFIHHTLLPDGYYSDESTELYPILHFKPNIAFLRQIRVQPQYRGDGWGRVLVEQMKRHFRSSCGLLIAYSQGAPKPQGLAHPLLPDTWERDEPFPESRLLRGLRFAGFHKLGSSDLFLSDLDN